METLKKASKKTIVSMVTGPNCNLSAGESKTVYNASGHGVKMLRALISPAM